MLISDFLQVAWAVALALSRCGCTALFASHFHELTALREYTEGAVQNLHMMVQVTPQQGLTFSFQVRPGACDKSFGVQVASLANFPPSVNFYRRFEFA
jgi:DNA mismatch repair ATPase MutS